MVFKKFLGSEKEEEQTEQEIDIEEYLSDLSVQEGKIIEKEGVTYVKPYDLKGEEDIDDIIQEIQKQNIIVLNVQRMTRDKVTLRKIINKLKDRCMQIDGDLGRISNQKILVVPPGIRLMHRS